MRRRPRLGGYGAPTPSGVAGLPLVAVGDPGPIGDSGPVQQLILHPGPQSKTPPEAGRPCHPATHSSRGRSPDAAWVGDSGVTVAQPFRSRPLSEPSGTGRSLATRSRRRPTSSRPVITVRPPPTGARSAHRRPLVSEVGLFGTLRLSTVRVVPRLSRTPWSGPDRPPTASEVRDVSRGRRFRTGLRPG